MVFQAYARYYDDLYGDKDYGGECDYLEKIFRRHGRRPVRKILDLGCGTGGHALILARRGYDVTGVDASAAMLARARQRSREEGAAVSFRRGDMRRTRLDERFDAVISMFAVVGYQTEDGDARRAMSTASLHLRRGGLFVFDVWFGPAVLHDPPGPKRKVVTTAQGRLVRSTTCRLDLLRQVVQVRFQTTLSRGGRTVGRAVEVHPMRFFFPRELSLLLEGAGLSQRLLAPFGRLRGKPGNETWNVAVVAEKTGTSSR